MDPMDLWRLVGAGAGACVALLAFQPVNARDAIARFSASEIFGFVMAPAVRHQLEWPEFPRLILCASFLCGLFAWFAIHAAVRLIANYQGPRK